MPPRIRYVPQGDDLPAAAPSVLDDGSDGWWAGAQRCFVAIPIAAALATVALSASVAFGYQQQPDDLPRPILYVNGGTAKTPDGSHASSLTVTIPATVAGNDLVVEVQNGDDPTPTPSAIVSGVTAAGATFERKGGAGNTSGTDSVNVEVWVWRNIPAGITSVTVNWNVATVGVVNVGQYSGVQSLGLVVTAMGSTAHPSLSLTTQDTNNVVVAGFGNEDTAQAAFAAASVGVFRSQAYGVGDGAPDVAGCLVDNTSSPPAAVACTLSYTPAVMWAAVALELRTTLVPVLEDDFWSVRTPPPPPVVTEFRADDDFVPQAAAGVFEDDGQWPQPTRALWEVPTVWWGDDVLVAGAALEEDAWWWAGPQPARPTLTVWGVEDEIVPQPALEEDAWHVSAPPWPAPRFLFLPDPEEIPAGSLYGVPEDAPWLVYTPPWSAPRFVFLPDPEELPAGALFGVPEEAPWEIPTPGEPRPRVLLWAVADELALAPPDEDGWPLPAPGLSRPVVVPWAFSDEIVPQPTVITPEDEAPRLVAAPSRLSTAVWWADDEIVPASALDEDYWQAPVIWRAPRAAAPTWWDDEVAPPAATGGLEDDYVWPPVHPPLRVAPLVVVWRADDDLQPGGAPPPAGSAPVEIALQMQPVVISIALRMEAPTADLLLTVGAPTWALTLTMEA